MRWCDLPSGFAGLAVVYAFDVGRSDSYAYTSFCYKDYEKRVNERKCNDDLEDALDLFYPSNTRINSQNLQA